MPGDLKDPRIIIARGCHFLVTGGMAAALLPTDHHLTETNSLLFR